MQWDYLYRVFNTVSIAQSVFPETLAAVLMMNLWVVGSGCLAHRVMAPRTHARATCPWVPPVAAVPCPSVVATVEPVLGFVCGPFARHPAHIPPEDPSPHGVAPIPAPPPASRWRCTASRWSEGSCRAPRSSRPEPRSACSATACRCTGAASPAGSPGQKSRFTRGTWTWFGDLWQTRAVR